MEATSRWHKVLDRGLGEFFPTSFREFVQKWIPLSIFIGLAVGLATVVFYYALAGVTAAFFPTPPAQPLVPWYLVFLLPTAGGLLVGFIIPPFAKETAGQGMDEVIRAVHFESGRIRSIVPPVKLVVSALTIGSGGSAGPEGPVGEIGAGTASILGRRLRLRRSDLRTFVLAGAAAGFSAIFKAPLGGALFALETPYKNDLEHGAAIPALIASTVSYLVFALTTPNGFAPIFVNLSAQPRFDAAHLVIYMTLGLLSGLVAVAFVRAFFWISDGFSKLKLPFAAKTTLGGLLCGLLGVVFPSVLGLGYSWDTTLIGGAPTSASLLGTTVTGLQFLFLALLGILFVKIVATSFTIGSGGSGGVLTPSLFVGATLGGLVGLVLTSFGFPFSPAVLVLVGMGAVLAAATKTPISSAVMLTEMVGGFSVLIPLILATVISYSVAGEHTLYKAQITRRAAPIDLSLLAGKKVQDVMVGSVATFRLETTAAEAQARVDEDSHFSYPVVDAEGRILGVAYRRDIRELVAKAPATPIAGILQTHFESVSCDAPAHEAFEAMNGLQVTRMLVLGPGRKLLGIITRLDILRAVDRAEEGR